VAHGGLIGGQNHKSYQYNDDQRARYDDPVQALPVFEDQTHEFMGQATIRARSELGLLLVTVSPRPIRIASRGAALVGELSELLVL
jgi:hypothetical protein